MDRATHPFAAPVETLESPFLSEEIAVRPVEREFASAEEEVLGTDDRET